MLAQEIVMLEKIAGYLNSSLDFNGIKAYKDSSAYTILEIDADATDKEVKAATEKWSKHHPDKLQQLRRTLKGAQEKFLKNKKPTNKSKKKEVFNCYLYNIETLLMTTTFLLLDTKKRTFAFHV